MRSRILVVLGAAVLTAATALVIVPTASAGSDRSPVASYIVTLNAGDPGEVAAGHERRRGVAVSHVYRHALRGYAARMSGAAAARLADDPRVADVRTDRVLTTTAQTLPPGIDRVQADVSSTVAGDRRGSVDVDIAIIDTGIDPKHRDLNVVGGVNCVPGGRSAKDLNGHGTHVAGTAAARDDNRGVVGVAPGARLWAVRVLDAQGSGLESTVLCGIDWVTARAENIEVANMSLGGAGSEGSCDDGGMHQAVCASVEAGVTYVVSAGNAAIDAGQFVPAAFDEVITVSAMTDFDGRPGGVGTPTCQTGSDDEFASFSNFGEDIDLIAPGMCVLSTWRGRGYRTISGTSMASPHVAGAAALYLAGRPGASPAAVRAALRNAGSFSWTGDPDGTKEPLVDVSTF